MFFVIQSFSYAFCYFDQGVSCRIFLPKAKLQIMSSRNLYTLLNISCSRILFKFDRREIGRQLLISSLEPFLQIGIVFPTFRRSGQTPEERDMLNITDKGWLTSFFRICRISDGMLLGPVAFLGSNELIMFSISDWSHS